VDEPSLLTSWTFDLLQLAPIVLIGVAYGVRARTVARRGQLRPAATLEIAFIRALGPRGADERPALGAIAIPRVRVDEDESDAGVEDGQRERREEAGVESIGDHAPPGSAPLRTCVCVEADEQAADRREEEDEGLHGHDQLEAHGDDHGHAEADPAREDGPPIDDPGHPQERESAAAPG
jgi:hypothetical protein